MVIVIDPLVDFACKLILGSPERIRITIHFLNAVLQLDSPIVDAEIRNPIIGRQYDKDKLPILDIQAKDAQGRIFNIEVQRELQAWLPQRLTYYASSQFVGQLRKGGNYLSLCQSIGICLLDAILFPTKLHPIATGYHHEFRLRSKSGLELTDSLAIHLLELPKYDPPSDNGIIVEPLDQWMYFFRNALDSTTEALAQRLADPIFAEVIGVLEMIAYSPEERRMYEERLKMRLDTNTLIEAAKAEGRQEGQKEGEEKGEQKGAIKLIRTLQEIGELPVSSEEELRMLNIEQLSALADDLRNRLRRRNGS